MKNLAFLIFFPQNLAGFFSSNFSFLRPLLPLGLGGRMNIGVIIQYTIWKSEIPNLVSIVPEYEPIYSNFSYLFCFFSPEGIQNQIWKSERNWVHKCQCAPSICLSYVLHLKKILQNFASLISSNLIYLCSYSRPLLPLGLGVGWILEYSL